MRLERLPIMVAVALGGGRLFGQAATTVYEGTLDSIVVYKSYTCGSNKSVETTETRAPAATITVSQEAICTGSYIKLDLVANTEMKTAKARRNAGEIVFEQGLWTSFRATALFSMAGGTTQLRMELPARDLDPSSGFPVSAGTCKEITLTEGPIGAPATDRTVTASVPDCTRNKTQLIQKRDNGEFFTTWAEAHTLLLRPKDSTADSANMGFEVTYNYRLNPVKVDLEPDHIEVVQVVQSAGNKVPLVAGKSTVARVFVRQKDPTAPTVSGVTGLLRGFRGGAQLPGSPLSPIATATATPTPDREQLVHSLNFVLPPTWTEPGNVVFEAQLNPDKAMEEDDYNNNRTETTVLFQEGRGLSVVYLEVCAGVPELCPTPAVRGLDSYIQKLYPAPDGAIRYAPLGPVWHWRAGLARNSPGESSLIAALRKRVYLAELQQGTANSQLVAWIAEGLGAALGLSDPLWAGAEESGRVSYCTDTSAVPLTMAPTPATGPAQMTDPADPAFTLAHELAHNFGLRHPNTTDGCNARDRNTDWPFTSAQTGETGFDTESRQVVSKSKFDVMSYCSPPASNIWMSPFSYGKLFDSRLEPRTKVSPQRSAQSAEYLVISGWANREGTAGGLDPGYRVTSQSPGEPANAGASHCLALSGGGASTYCFPLTFLDHRTGRERDQASFTLKVPWPAGTTRAALTRDGRELAVIETASGAPVLTVVSPQPGERWSGPRTISWSAGNAGAQPRFGILYSADGVTWNPIDHDLDQTQFEVDTAQLEPSAEGRFKILATNGLATAEVIAGPVEIVAAPCVRVWPVALDFGKVAVGSEGALTLLVDNAGSSGLPLGAIESSRREVSLTGDLTGEIPLRSLRRLTARFRPVESGEASGQISVATGDERNPAVTIEWKGIGVAPKIAVSPASLDFGEVTAGQSKVLEVTIRNVGLAPLSVTSLTVSNVRFTVSGPVLPAALPPEASATVSVRFTPAAEGAQQGTLSIASNDPGQAAMSVALTGRGTAAAVPLPKIAVSPPALDFGPVTTGQNRVLNLTVANTGAGPLTVSAVTPSHAAFTVAGAIPLTVAPAGSAILPVRFAPSAAGAVTGTLEISSNDPASPKTLVNLSGTGVAPSTNPPKIEVSPATVNFGTVRPQSQTTQPLQVRNTGASTLTITAVTIPDTRFVLVGIVMPVTVAPQSAVAWSVRFTAGNVGAVNATMTIASNDPATAPLIVPLVAEVAGTALAPKIRVSPAALDFGTIRVGAEGEVTIEVGNTGNAPLEVDSIASSNPRFKVASSARSFTVPAASVYDVRVTFTPASAGTEQGVLRIVSNDAGSPTDLPMTGTGR